uniref:Testis-specific serine/threonine-protein kinase 4 n=1 Tax=Lygus hesperus TaxID=30085 RepID=A0A0A9X052_LYGHE
MASHLHHACLVNYFGITEDNEDLLLVMDLSEKGNLKEYQRRFGVAETRVMAPRFVADIVLALQYLHDGRQHPFSPRLPLSCSTATTTVVMKDMLASSYDNNDRLLSSMRRMPCSQSSYDLHGLSKYNSQEQRRQRYMLHKNNINNNNNDITKNKSLCRT